MTEDEIAKRHERAGAHLFDLAQSLGWKEDDQEGAWNFLSRKTYEVAVQDCTSVAEAARDAIWTAAIEAAAKVCADFVDHKRKNPDDPDVHSLTASDIGNVIRALTRPSDMVTVPREPNDKMATTGARAIRDTFGATNQHARAKTIYRAMIRSSE